MNSDRRQTVLSDRLSRGGPIRLLERAAAAGVSGVEALILAHDTPSLGLFFDAGPSDIRAWRARAAAAGLRFVSGCVEIDGTGAGDPQAAILLARKALYLVRDLGGDLLRIVMTGTTDPGARCRLSATWVQRLLDAVGRIAAWDAGNDAPPYRTVCVSFAFDAGLTRCGLSAPDLPGLCRDPRATFRTVNLALGYGPIVGGAADIEEAGAAARYANGGEFVLRGPEIAVHLDEALTDRALAVLGEVYDGPILVAASGAEDPSSLARACAQIASRPAPRPDWDPLKQDYASSIARLFRPYGTARLETAAEIEAGTLDTWRYVFRVAEPGIATGGGIKIALNRACGLYGWQVSDPAKPDYIKASAPPGVTLETRIVSEDACRVLHVVVAGGALKPGDEIRVIFGDREGGSPGIGAQTDRERGARLFTRVDASGNGMYFEVHDVPSFQVISTQPARLRLAAPQTVAAGKPFTVRIAVDDRWGNPARGSCGRIQLRVDGRVWPAEPCPQPGAQAVIHVDGVTLETPGIHELAAAAGPAVEEARLPVECRAQGDKRLSLYWGDIHGHTGLMDAMGTPDEYFAYGRDIGFLDFCSCSEHMDGLFDGRQLSTPEQWRAIVETTRQYHEPGRFVTLLGYECSQDWDANVYFPGDEAPWFVTAFPSRLFQFARRHGALVIPHMTTYPQRGRGYDWGYYDGAVLPAIEIYSCHGANERFGGRYPVRGCEPGGYAQEALDLGRRIGFIGSGDSHCGKPGNARLGGYPSGMVAIYAAELSRQAVFDALRSRRCYATTGSRILAWFDVAGCFMGGETTAPPGTSRVLRCGVYGTGPLERVDVVSNGEDLHTVRPADTRCEFDYADDRPLAAATYYYVRVTQADGAMAWLSPVWVSPRL